MVCQASRNPSLSSPYIIRTRLETASRVHSSGYPPLVRFYQRGKYRGPCESSASPAIRMDARIVGTGAREGGASGGTTATGQTAAPPRAPQAQGSPPETARRPYAFRHAGITQLPVAWKGTISVALALFGASLWPFRAPISPGEKHSVGLSGK